MQRSEVRANTIAIAKTAKLHVKVNKAARAHLWTPTVARLTKVVVSLSYSVLICDPGTLKIIT
jgi:hypothetical protein